MLKQAYHPLAFLIKRCVFHRSLHRMLLAHRNSLDAGDAQPPAIELEEEKPAIAPQGVRGGLVWVMASRQTRLGQQPWLSITQPFITVSD